MMSVLRTYGYDYVTSIEHEDLFMSVNLGFSCALTNLKYVIILDQPTDM